MAGPKPAYDLRMTGVHQAYDSLYDTAGNRLLNTTGSLTLMKARRN